MAEVQARLQSLSEDYQKLQQDLQATVASRQKLEGQKQENLGVQKEFDHLADDETIYKLVGPVLLRQDKVEAESTVKGRLDFISAEMLVSQTVVVSPHRLTGWSSSRLEGQIQETQEKLEKKKTEIIQIQAAAQGAAAGHGKQAAQ